jgi:hypothetical protein
MKKIILLTLTVLIYSSVFPQPYKSFFLPDELELSKDLPFPGDLQGYTFGEWHFSHDQLINYLQKLSDKSERVTMWKYGETHENRPLYLLAITSPGNQEKLETLRLRHLHHVQNKLAQNPKEDPVFIWLGYSVHGNESSPGNASMLTAYHLAATKSKEVKRILNHSVILIDPCLNPDGFTRAANWSNMHIHNTTVKTPYDRQFREDWPGGRTNHYWFDLNRDWLPAQHPESQARLEMFHKWKPHIVTDHHEMGSNSTFFFQPGVPERMNPRTPERNIKLTRKIASYHAKALDKTGTLYFSEESFDDFYYGKGSTYPDVNGSIGILFEQSRVMGQVIQNKHGELSFADAINNHYTVSLSTIRAAIKMKTELFSYQQQFYSKANKLAKKDKVKGYIFGDEKDKVKVFHFLKMLKKHEIEIYSLKKNIRINGKKFKSGSSYLVPTQQDQYRLIKSIFEKRTSFEDNVFYDVSSWTMPLAFDIPCTTINNPGLMTHKGSKLEELRMPEGKIFGKASNVGYIANGNNYNIHALLYQLKKKGLLAKVAAKEFSTRIKSKEYHFSNGSIFIPVNKQKIKPAQLHEYLKKLSTKYGINLVGMPSSLTDKGIDLGSRYFVPVKKPEILLVAGEGVSSRSAGEIWHLLDHRMDISVVLIKPEHLKRINLFEYNTLILPNGRYSFENETTKKIEFWLEEGGVMLALENANQWLRKEDWISWERKENPEENSSSTLPYGNRRKRRRINSISGVILEAAIDPTHPVVFGIDKKQMPVLKNNNLFIKKSSDPYATPVMIKEKPLLTGYLSKKNQEKVEHTAWCLVGKKGRGTIISFVDNPNFRGYWYGTNRLFMNAIFYGDIIR